MERKAHFDELVGGVEDYAIFMMSRTGIILDWNRGAERLKGYQPHEIVGKHFSRFYSQDEILHDIPGEELEVAAAHGKFSTAGWRLRQDGTRFWASVTISAISSSPGKVEGFLKITRDLSERQEAQEALRQSEERLRLLIQSVVDYAIFMLDVDGNIVSWNEGARRIKGYESSEIIGLHFSRFYTTEALAAQLPQTLLAKALQSGSAEDEGWRVKKSGERFWGSVLITAVRDETGEHRGFVKITRDLTERRRTELAEKASSKKDTFLATLAHELRNPLAPLLPGLEIMLRTPHDTGRVVQIGTMMKRQVNQMSQLIEDLVDLSRITTGRIHLRQERFPLAECIEMSLESVRPALEAQQHQLSLKMPPFLLEVNADRTRLTQAITNLLVNATKYTPNGGMIELDVSLPSEGVVQINVSDNGVGLTPELMGRVFDLFEQGASGSPDGLGIGLTLVRTIVELHGGDIKVASPGINEGSIFTMTLPIAVGGTTSTHFEPCETSESGRCRALVVDDIKDNATMLALFLGVEGWETSLAYDGKQAVDMVDDIQPDLVCLDLGMPVLDGFEAAVRIREKIPGAVIISVSGWGSDEDRQKTQLAGFDYHLVKPVKTQDLSEILHARLGRCYKG